MIFLDKTKNLRIYKTQSYLPTLEDDKKRFSTTMLLTPNFESSKRLMESDLFINKLRYSSYYLERELSYYINDKSIKAVDEEELTENYNYQTLNEMSAAERNKLPDSAFGIPSKRKYPLDTEAHVRSAIKFFNYCDKEDEAELARNIIKAMKKFNITDVKVSEKNRFSKYYHPEKSTNESYTTSDDIDFDSFVTESVSLLEASDNDEDFDDVVDDSAPKEPSKKTKGSYFEELGGALFNRVTVNKKDKIFTIKGVNFKKFLLRLKEMYNHRGLSKLFEKKYSYFDLKLWKMGLKSKNNMNIVSLDIPLYFALELFNIFKDLSDFYELGYYRTICKNIYNKTWISNWEKNKYVELDTSILSNILSLELKDYQKEFITKYGKLKHIYDLNGYILCFEQGLGKTLTSIALAETLRKEQIVIVCPNSLKENWAYEIKSYYKVYANNDTLWREDVYVHNSPKFNKAKNPKFIIVNQDAIDKIYPVIKKNKNSMLIVDEVHNFRDIDSMRTKQLLNLKDLLNCEDNLLMSGTPIKANAAEIIPMLRMIDPYFTDELAKLYKKAFNAEGIKIADVVKSRFSRIMFRKTKDEVLNLPEKHVNELYLEMPNPSRYYLSTIKEQISKEVENQIATRKDSVEKYKVIFEKMVLKYSSASNQETRDFLKYVSKTSNFFKIDEDQAAYKEVKYKYFLKENVYPNIKDKDELKRFNEAKTNYVTFMQSCIGKAIGSILPAARSKCYKELFEKNISKFIHMIDKSTKKTIIFTPFLEVANYVNEALNAKGVGTVKIIGETSDRMEVINKFKMEDSIDVLVATTQTLSTGFTLTEANQMFFLGTPYRKADFDQACDRIHRIGQTSEVNIYITLLKSEKPNVTTRIYDIMTDSGESSEALIVFEDVSYRSLIDLSLDTVTEAAMPKSHVCYDQLEYVYQCWKNHTLPESVARQQIYQIRANHMANDSTDTPATMPTPEEYYKSKGTLVSEECIYLYESNDKSTIDIDFKSKSGKTFRTYNIKDSEAQKYIPDSWQWAKNSRLNGEILVCLNDNKVAGFITVATDGWIRNLRIYDKYRGYGQSKVLMQHAITMGGYLLGVFADNEVAIKLYKSLGFKEISRKKQGKTEYITMQLQSTIKEDYSTKLFMENLKSINHTNLGDLVLLEDDTELLEEDAKYDSRLKKLLFSDRIKKRNELVTLYDSVKANIPFIKYAFPDIARYQSKNLFVDLYYYNGIFFKNNTWVQKRGYDLYYDFLTRLINNSKYKKAGYKLNTIFIPVPEWDIHKNSDVWNFKTNINPISIIYQALYTNGLAKLTKLFGNTNLVFVGKTTYFRLNFKEIKEKEIRQAANKFKNFVIKICTTEEFDAEDIDTSADNVNSPEVITANIVDTIDVNKGVDITPQVAAIKSIKAKKPNLNNFKLVKFNDDEAKNSIKADKVDVANIDKMTLSNNTTNPQTKANIVNQKKIALAAKIVRATANAKDEDEAYSELDYQESEEDTESITALLQDIQSNSDDSIDVSVARTKRMNELDEKLMDTQIKGKSVKEILNEQEPAPIVTDLNIATPTDDWSKLTFTNFDKNYNVDKDILAAIRHLSTTSRPLAVKDISVENTSTSEDRIETYSVSLEDYRGKRFSFKLDIPIMVDNRFLLRGNNKSIQTQLVNMPIIKTETDTCQIISNYMKIFVYRVGDSQGRSYPLSSRFIKACGKYTGKYMKITNGDCSKVSSRYQLPIDYIGISSFIYKIETPDIIIYFNQDEIRSLYEIDETQGIPYAYSKINKQVVYLSDNDPHTFIDTLITILDIPKNEEFMNTFDSVSAPAKCSFSRCSIMSSDIPLVIICAYHEGLRKVLDKAAINYKIVDKLTSDLRSNRNLDWIKFSDGYLVYELTYSSSLLLNGLKSSPTESYSLGEIDNKNMYLELLDDFGGRYKAYALDNFYDLMVDPITKEVLDYYKLPDDYVSILLYANALLSDNKYIRHTDMSSRRLRRYELIAVYTYKVLAEAYASYASQLKSSRAAAEFYVKQSAVIDRFLLDPISSEDSCINALRDLETTNAVTTKGPSGMNSDRAYSLDKRTYDPSMENILGMSTGFAGNVGVTRQATVDSNVEGTRGYVKLSDGDTSKMTNSSVLTATEAMSPMGTTHDDPFRTAMNFIQTSKHEVRTIDGDPLLVTSGMDEAMPYLSSDAFAFKAKKDGVIAEITEDYIIVDYNDGTHDYVKLEETIQKNSDGGYYVPLKLDTVDGLKVGQKIKSNQILAYDKLSYSNNLGESNNLAYNIGKLAKVAIINTDDGFEDSGVITKSLSEKLSTYIDLQYDKILEKDTTVLYMAKVGDKVEVGDNLLVWNEVYEDENANALLKSLTSDEISELGKKKLTSEVTGIVKGIKIFRTTELDELSESLKKIVSNYEKKYNALEKKLTALGLDKSNIPAHTKLPATGKLKKAQDAVLIEFYVEYRDTVGVGDKIVYDRANKSVIKDQIPEGKEPYTEFRPKEHIDAFVSEVSIDKRMVTSTVLVGAMNKLLIELDRSVKDIMGIDYDESKL